MESKEFVEFLKNPSHMSDSDLTELEKIVSTYPYFQSARALLAKRKNEINPKIAGPYIASAAVYLTDRPLLKKYISDKLFFLQEEIDVKKHNSAQEKQSSDSLKKSKPEVESKKPSSKAESSVAQPPAVTKKAEPVTAEPPDIDNLIAEIYQDMENLKESKARFKAWEDKYDEEEAVSSVIKKASKADTKASAPKDEKSSKPVEKKEPKTTKKPLKSEEKQNENKKVKATKIKSETSKKVTGTTTPKTSKAKSKKESPAKTEEKFETKVSKKKESKVTSPKKETKKPTAKKRSVKDPSSSDAPVPKRSRGERKQDESRVDQKKIISEFIDKEPAITSAKKGQTKSKGDLSEKSSRFQADVSSEYLAEIYIEQGKFNRAIEIYESLRLKFPKKESFFAAQIEKLKKK